MKKANQQEVVVKKVKAFPIAGQLKTGAGTAIPIKIVKLTDRGFLAEVMPTAIQPGEKFESTFEIPVQHRMINEPVVMVKLYHHWGADGAAPTSTPVPNPEKAPAPAATGSLSGAPAGVAHLIEVHFQNLNPDNRKHIHSFLSAATKRSS